MKNEVKLQRFGYLVKNVSPGTQKWDDAPWKFGPDIRLYYKRFGLDEQGRATWGTASICLMRYDAEKRRAVDWIPEIDIQYLHAMTSETRIYIRGISFCSPLDQFVKSTGRAMAIGRAIKAIEKETSSDRVSVDGPAGELLDFGFDYRSAYDVKLTEEEKLLFKIKEVPNSPVSTSNDLLTDAMNKNKLPDGTSE